MAFDKRTKRFRNNGRGLYKNHKESIIEINEYIPL